MGFGECKSNSLNENYIGVDIVVSVLLIQYIK